MRPAKTIGKKKNWPAVNKRLGSPALTLEQWDGGVAKWGMIGRTDEHCFEI